MATRSACRLVGWVGGKSERGRQPDRQVPAEQLPAHSFTSFLSTLIPLLSFVRDRQTRLEARRVGAVRDEKRRLGVSEVLNGEDWKAVDSNRQSEILNTIDRLGNRVG